VSGGPGVVFTSGGALIHAVSPRTEGGVRAVSMTRDPDKLSRWSVAGID
jgi:RNA polymerase sigma-70 factor, ECF subfamily